MRVWPRADSDEETTTILCPRIDIGEWSSPQCVMKTSALPAQEDGQRIRALCPDCAGSSSYQDDMVGHLVPRGRRPMLDAALDEGRIVREGDPEWREEVPVRVESIPVRREGRVLGVIARNTNLLTVRTPSRLELTYLQSASDLAQMIAAGSVPFPGQQVDMDASPRVGD